MVSGQGRGDTMPFESRDIILNMGESSEVVHI